MDSIVKDVACLWMICVVFNLAVLLPLASRFVPRTGINDAIKGALVGAPMMACIGIIIISAVALCTVVSSFKHLVVIITGTSPVMATYKFITGFRSSLVSLIYTVGGGQE